MGVTKQTFPLQQLLKGEVTLDDDNQGNCGQQVGAW